MKNVELKTRILLIFCIIFLFCTYIGIIFFDLLEKL